MPERKPSGAVHSGPPRRERGAALLTVLLLVAVVAVIAGTTLEKLRLSTRVAGNAIAIEAARGFGRAAESLALARVTDLLGRNAARVTLAGGWSDRPFGLPLPGGGQATARVRDGGNCFNLNGLVTRTPTGYVTFVPARIVFARLMRLVGVPGQSADGIAAAAADWIDTDGDQQPGGAEDQAYQSLPQPYRTPGTLMADASELRAVQGVTPEIYAKLRPWICALPESGPATINVNTLPPEKAPLVAALAADTLSPDAVRQALLARPPDGFRDAAAFWAAMPGGDTANASNYTGVTTRWFDLDVVVQQGGATLEQHGLIDASRPPAQIVSRQWGERQ